MTLRQRSGSNEVNDFVSKLEQPAAGIAAEIRRIVLDCSPEISEHIKWNSPSFYFNGEMQPFDPKQYKRDIAVTNFHRGRAMLVFPEGSKLNDPEGFLEGNYTDGRRIVNFKDEQDVLRREQLLRKAIAQWLDLVER